MSIRFQNDCLEYVISPEGKNLHFIDRRTGCDYLQADPPSPFARVKKGGQDHDSGKVCAAGSSLAVEFPSAGVRAEFRVLTRPRYFILEVASLTGESVEELLFGHVPLALQGCPDEPFAACALALNLQTNVPGLPGPSRLLRALCYPRFGFAGAQAALVACPPGEMREALQEAVLAAPDLPHSPLGGPWALDAPINEGSYLFNFGNVTEETVGDWIELLKKLGMSQLDFHGGRSFRFGDCRPDPAMYARGLASLRAVIARLHDAGIAAGLHTYAFFMDKRCPWVTPVPDPRLGKDARFTLARALAADEAIVPVEEPTGHMSAITGFFVRNSATLQVEDELITYTGVSKDSPFGFTGCTRGALGTRPSPHPRGSPAHHLKECFGLFAPDGDSTLLGEVASCTAEAFNECGFDMMYLDALDGEDVLGGPENGWHYGSKFVFELWRRLHKPALMEMSTFHHHLWTVRSRLGAWDHPTRSHKKFIDIHVRANEDCRRIFLPAHLGWWAVKTWEGPQGEPTYPDDIEYLCGKALGTDTGLSLMGIEPGSMASSPALARLAVIFQRYETLRCARAVPEAVKARLRVPGEEFRLVEQPGGGGWRFRPVEYARHKLEASHGSGRHGWQVRNRFGPQPLRCRIEALFSAEPYDSDRNRLVADFHDPLRIGDSRAQEGVTAGIEPGDAPDMTLAGCGRFTAMNSRPERRGSWASVTRRFSPPLNLKDHRALGVWVHGDGQGEVLNFQLRSPEHVTGAIGDHYVIVDFLGWRYISLIEPEGERYDDYAWPYGSIYSIYRESVDFAQIESLSLWYNHLPPGRPVACWISPVRALPLAKACIRNPGIEAGGRTLLFPSEIETGCCLEGESASEYVLYGPRGERLREVEPRGDPPILAEGVNSVAFVSEPREGAAPVRARVTVIAEGPFLGGSS
ncbi:MAG: hypothetical protein HYU36_01300 [Planctomycetes bacterium]|nr:hypothetical protein [Planctomycetota bacterium]